MRSTFAISLAALAGSAIAAPSYNGYANQAANGVVDLVIETVVHTVYVTEGSPEATPCSTSTSAVATPVYQSSAIPVYQVETPSPSPSTVAYTPAPYTEETPAPTTTTATPTATPTASTGTYMDVVAKWRSKLGLSTLEFSELLQSNALKTVTDGNGVMKHELNSGTYGQVLAPGEADEFERVFVGGWLCEMPNLAGLDGICDTMSAGWDYEGQTGHAEILTSPNYSKIACSNLKGIWCCDLA